MRKIMILAAVIGMAGILWGADPIIGTWKLNAAKSKFPPSQQAPPKEETRVIRELDADRIQNTSLGTRMDGSPISNRATWPKTGGDVKFEEVSSKAISAVAKTAGPGDWYFTVRLSGNQAIEYHHVVSRDGKTLRETIKGTDAQGKPFEGLLVFEKR